MSQGPLAELLGLSQQQISKYERGEDRVPLEVLRKVEAICGRSFGGFVQGAALPGGGAVGFTEAEAAPYVAEASPAAAADFERPELMMLDLTMLRNPADRQSLRDLYCLFLERQGEG